MNDGVTVSVQVPAPASPEPTPGHTAPPPAAPGAPLPFTGADVGTWLTLVVVLVLLGAVLVRRAAHLSPGDHR